MGLGKSSVVGQVILWAGGLATISGEQEPVSGWLLCNGAALLKTNPKYASLYSIIAGTYGSDVSNFYLPNAQGRSVIGRSATYPLGTVGGTETTTISTTEMPSHGHTLASFGIGDSGSSGHTHGAFNTGAPNQNHTHTNVLPSKSIQQGTGSAINVYTTSVGTLINNVTLYGASTPVDYYHTHTVTGSSTGSHTHSVTAGAYGSGSAPAHNNLPPFASVHFLIRY